MRENLFRGKLVGDLATWIHGYYHFDKTLNAHYICLKDSLYQYEVRAETVGQLLEFKDKDEIDIYESDIVRFHYFYQSLGANLGAQESEHELIGIITMRQYGWGVSAIKGEHWQGYTGYSAGEGESNIVDLYAMNESSLHEESFEVIGNIFDNPELITQ